MAIPKRNLQTVLRHKKRECVTYSKFKVAYIEVAYIEVAESNVALGKLSLAINWLYTFRTDVVYSSQAVVGICICKLSSKSVFTS